MPNKQTTDDEMQSQVARVRTLTEAVALPLDAQRLDALAQRLPGPSPLDCYDFGETEPPSGLRLAADQMGEPSSGERAE